jgi:hypothetical protein
MIRRTGVRGQPLVLFGAVLAAWLAFRIAMWESPVVHPVTLSAQKARLVAAPAVPLQTVREQGASMAQAIPVPGKKVFARAPARFGGAADAPFATRPVVPPMGTVSELKPEPPSSVPHVPLNEPPAVPRDGRLLPESQERGHLSGARPAYRQAHVSRWSADGWLLLRREGAPGAAGPVLSDRSSYGRSQAGAVIRYAILPESPLQPRAHVRAASALSGQRERELAAGVSFRLLPGVPLRAVAEARAVEAGASRHFRPAAYAVTEFPPVALPMGLRAEAYVQGGYVGGDFPTAFVDGQARAESLLSRVGEGALSAGAGAWGGAQRGSSRLDVGPTASVTFQLGEMRGRLAADYRFRVAGMATPESGPTLTLSAGF